MTAAVSSPASASATVASPLSSSSDRATATMDLESGGDNSHGEQDEGGGVLPARASSSRNLPTSVPARGGGAGGGLRKSRSERGGGGGGNSSVTSKSSRSSAKRRRRKAAPRQQSKRGSGLTSSTTTDETLMSGSGNGGTRQKIIDSYTQSTTATGVPSYDDGDGTDHDGGGTGETSVLVDIDLSADDEHDGGGRGSGGGRKKEPRSSPHLRTSLSSRLGLPGNALDASNPNRRIDQEQRGGDSSDGGDSDRHHHAGGDCSSGGGGGGGGQPQEQDPKKIDQVVAKYFFKSNVNNRDKSRTHSHHKLLAGRAAMSNSRSSRSTVSHHESHSSGLTMGSRQTVSTLSSPSHLGPFPNEGGGGVQQAAGVGGGGIAVQVGEMRGTIPPPPPSHPHLRFGAGAGGPPMDMSCDMVSMEQARLMMGHNTPSMHSGADGTGGGNKSMAGGSSGASVVSVASSLGERLKRGFMGGGRGGGGNNVSGEPQYITTSAAADAMSAYDGGGGNGPPLPIPTNVISDSDMPPDMSFQGSMMGRPQRSQKKKKLGMRRGSGSKGGGGGGGNDMPLDMTFHGGIGGRPQEQNSHTSKPQAALPVKQRSVKDKMQRRIRQSNTMGSGGSVCSAHSEASRSVKSGKSTRSAATYRSYYELAMMAAAAAKAQKRKDEGWDADDDEDDGPPLRRPSREVGRGNVNVDHSEDDEGDNSVVREQASRVLKAVDDYYTTGSSSSPNSPRAPPGGRRPANTAQQGDAAAGSSGAAAKHNNMNISGHSHPYGANGSDRTLQTIGSDMHLIGSPGSQDQSSPNHRPPILMGGPPQDLSGNTGSGASVSGMSYARDDSSPRMQLLGTTSAVGVVPPPSSRLPQESAHHHSLPPPPHGGGKASSAVVAAQYAVDRELLNDDDCEDAVEYDLSAPFHPEADEDDFSDDDDSGALVDGYHRYLRRLTGGFVGGGGGSVSDGHDRLPIPQDDYDTGTDDERFTLDDRSMWSDYSSRRGGRSMGHNKLLCVLVSACAIIASVSLAVYYGHFRRVGRDGGGADRTSVSTNAFDGATVVVPANDGLESHPHHGSVFELLSQVSDETALRGQDTPQRLAMKWLMDDPTLRSYVEDDNGRGPELESTVFRRYAMATFFYSLGGGGASQGGGRGQNASPTSSGGWTKSTNWLSDLTVCQWHGVKCSSSDSTAAAVQEIRLVGNNVRGVIPEEIKLLTGVLKLDLSNNRISGELPRGFSQLSRLLELRLSNNQLSGQLDVGKIGNPEILEVLILDGNEMTGQLNSSIGRFRSLYLLRLSNNNFTGDVPKEIGQLSRMYELDLASNEFSGNIPAEVGQLFQLRQLKLSNNVFSGPIPDDLIHASELNQLHLNSNRLQGEIPLWIGALRSLRALYLDDNLLTGQIPDLRSLTMLDELTLESNKLEGTVPLSICKLNLRLLSADCGEVSCSCCTACYDTDNSLNKADEKEEELDVSDGSDSSTESVPAVGISDNAYDAALTLLAEISNVEAFRDPSTPQRKALGWLLTDNVYTQFAADPASAGEMDVDGTPLKLLLLQRYAMATFYYSTGTNLSWDNSLNWISSKNLCDWFGVVCDGGRIKNMLLADNGLSGLVPNELQVFPDLASIDLSSNKLSGSVPKGLGSLSNLRALSLHRNNFSGPIPQAVCSLQLNHLSADCLGNTAIVQCSCCTECVAPIPGN